MPAGWLPVRESGSIGTNLTCCPLTGFDAAGAIFAVTEASLEPCGVAQLVQTRRAVVPVRAFVL
jgi:hypothetical protein